MKLEHHALNVYERALLWLDELEAGLMGCPHVSPTARTKIEQSPYLECASRRV